MFLTPLSPLVNQTWQIDFKEIIYTFKGHFYSTAPGALQYLARFALSRELFKFLTSRSLNYRRDLSRRTILCKNEYDLLCCETTRYEYDLLCCETTRYVLFPFTWDLKNCLISKCFLANKFCIFTNYLLTRLQN